MRLDEFIISAQKLRDTYKMKNPKKEKLLRMNKVYAAKNEPLWLELFNGNKFPLGARAHMPSFAANEPYRDRKRIKASFQGKLHPYQNDALELLIDTDITCGLVKSATGSGKTVMMGWLLSHFKERTLVLVKGRQLMYQIRDSLVQFTSLKEEDIGIYGDGKKELKDVTIMTQSSFLSCKEKLEYDCYMVDEADTFMGEKTRYRLFDLEGCRMFGFTATPYTDTFTERELVLVFGPITNVKYDLPKPKIKVVHYDNGESFNGDEKPYTKFRADVIDADEKRIDYHTAIVARALALGWGTHILVLYDRIEAVCQFNDKMKGSYVILGETPMDERKQQVEDFKVTGGVLVATEMTVGRGFDLPRIDCVCIFFPNKFSGRLTQMMGRALRKDDTKGQPTVVDFCDLGVIWQGVSRMKTYRDLWGESIPVDKYQLN